MSNAKYSSIQDGVESGVGSKQRIIAQANNIDKWTILERKQLEKSDYLGALEHLDREKRVEMAAVLLSDAINNMTTRHRIETKFDRDSYLFLHSRFFRGTIVTGMCVLHMMLIFVEDPSEYTFDNRRTVCMVLDMCCIAFHMVHFVFRLMLRLTRKNKGAEANALSIASLKTSFKKKTRRLLRGRTEQFELFAFLVAVAMLVENLIFLSASFKTYRFLRALRVVFLVDAQPLLKKLVRNCLSSIIALREVLLLSAAVIVFFSLTAIVVWPPGTTAEGATHFYSVHRAIMSFIFASMGAVNFPDIMLPAVNEDFRSSCLFFMTFMVLVVVWLLNLCLATVYQQYRSFLSRRSLHQHKTRRRALMSAFILLDVDGDDNIDRDEFLRAVKLVKDLDEDDEEEVRAQECAF